MSLHLHGAAPYLTELRAALVEVGVDAALAPSLEEAVRRASADPQSRLVLGFSGGVTVTPPAEIAQETIALIEDPSAADLARLGQAPVGLLFGKQGRLDVRAVAAAIARRLKERGSDLKDHLAAGAPISRLQITNSGDRGAVLESFEQALAGRKLDVRILNQLLTVVDELITNACYHAPVDATGRRPYANKPRIEAVPSNERPIDFAYGWDDHVVAVGIRDHYGSLAPATLLTHLAKAFGAAEADLASAGAAIGLATAFRCASSLVFELAGGRFTECIGAVEANRSYRQFLEQGKSFELHYLPPPKGMSR